MNHTVAETLSANVDETALEEDSNDSLYNPSAGTLGVAQVNFVGTCVATAAVRN